MSVLTSTRKRFSDFEKDEIERKLELYYGSSGDLLFSKELFYVLFMLVLAFEHFILIYRFLPSGHHPESPLLISVSWTLLIILALPLVIHLLWSHAAKRAKVQEVQKILSTNRRYGPVLDGFQKEILRALREGTERDERSTTP